MRISVKAKLLIPILSVVFIGIVIIQTLSYIKSSRILEEEIFEGIRRNSEIAAMRLDDWVRNRTADITHWSRDDIYQETLMGNETARIKIAHVLSHKIDDYSYYESVDLINSKGIVAASSNPKNIGIDIKDRAYFHQSIKGKVVVSDLIISKSSNKPTIVIAAPIKNNGLSCLGILIGVIKLDFLDEKIISAIKIGKTGYAAVMAKDGLLIAHPDKTFVMKYNIKDTDFGKYIMANKNGRYKYFFQLQKQWKGMSFNLSEKTGWTIIVTAPLDELMQGIREVRNHSGIGALILTVVVMLVIWSVVDKIVDVIRLAARYLRTIAKGDISQDIIEKYLKMEDEFGDMAKSFEDMVNAHRKKVSLARAIADGHLDTEVVLASDKDLLGQALKNMLENLNRLISMVHEAGVQIASGASEVSDSSQALSQGASQQASSLQQISSSMTQIASRTKTNAESASKASNLASESCDMAFHANREMAKMLQAMEEINDSAKSVAKIMKVIDEIAFQTNLLALNAAVEAARAGRHGKGFAVVAGEVRNLANRSALAAKETGEMIQNSITKIKKGSEIALQTSQSLNNIVEASSQMSELAREIAAGSNEQAQAIAQINQGILQIEQVTQQNTATAEETAAAAQQLTSQAEQLKQALAYFVLNREPGVSELALNPTFKAVFGSVEDERKELLALSSENKSYSFTK